MSETADLFEIMRTTRSMRRLKPDPVPDDVLARVLEAGTCAASGGNSQQWRFLLIRDAAVKAAAAVWWRKAWQETAAPRYRSGGPAPGMSQDKFERLLTAVDYLAEHIHEAPVWIVPCWAGPRGSGASIYPAVQNMLLAARALGLGSTLTTVYLMHEKEAEAAMGIGEGFHSWDAILPIGYPMGKFGPVRREPLAGVVYDGAWGKAWSGT